MTFRPEEIVTARNVDVITQTGQRKFADREIDLDQNTSDGVLGACLERYWSEDYSNPGLERGGGEVRATSRYRLYVMLPQDRTIRDMQAAYNSDFDPPSKPFEPELDGWRKLIAGEETDEGIQFTLPISKKIRDVTVSNFDLFASDPAVRLRDDTVVLPYEELSPTYLERPVTKVRVTMTTTEEVYYLRLPYPDVSIESVDPTTRSNDDSVQLEQLSAEVRVESKKPTQYVNVHTDFGGSLSRDYGGIIGADDFEAVSGSGTTRLTRDFSRLPYSQGSTVDSDDFREWFPVRQDEFSIVVGQLAPLARKDVPRSEIVE